jgi:hypothetical protein
MMHAIEPIPKLLLSKPMPEELYQGYLGRLSILNGFDITSALLRKIRERAGDDSSFCPPTGILAPIEPDVSLGQLIQHHTLLPYHRAVVNARFDRPHDQLDSQDYSQLHSLARGFKGYFCPECVREDHQYWGFSYWRRAHQLPGVACCSKHNTQLAHVFRGESVFSEMIKPCHAGSYDFTKREFREILQNPVLHRFNEISYALLEFRFPMSCASAKECMSHAISLRPSGGTGTDRLFISEMACQRLPKSWLDKNSFDLERPRCRRVYPKLDTLSFLIGDTTRIAIALALLFDTVEDAINHWAAFHRSAATNRVDEPVEA